LSINTLDGRVLATPVCSENFDKYFDGTWKLGGAKLLQSPNGCWTLHIGATKQLDGLELSDVKHVVGIDRGLRFLVTTCDEKGNCSFVSGKEIMRKRDKFAKTRERLQRKHTWSAKRALRRIENRENRWMTDINHQLSKTLVERYGEGTLFVLEDLTGVSFDENNLSKQRGSGKRQLRSWSFYQLEQFLGYKARLADSAVVKVAAEYTSQRCPKCGGIHKEFRNHKTHEYVCGNCGYQANDDLTGARNIYVLGTMYVSGVEKPKFERLEPTAN
jgi:IS605 OrfB family transposase